MKPLDKALLAAAGNVTAAPPSDAWNLIKYQPAIVSSSAWDISEAVYGNESAKIFGLTPRGVIFKPDGTKMYTLDAYTGQIREFTAPQPWNTYGISGSDTTYTYSVTSQEGAPSAMYFKPDGTKLYVAGYSSDAVYEYALSTAWDLSTASYNNKTKSVSNEETNPTGLFFKSDGTKMYVCGTTGDDINEYDLTTAWDITTASYSQNFSVSAQDTLPREIYFKSDGLTMWIVGDTGNTIEEYSLSTAWDISTASYAQTLSIGGYEGNPSALAFKPDGSMMFLMGYAGDDITEFIIAPITINVNSQQQVVEDVFFKTDGTRMFIIGATGPDWMHQYDLSTAWDLTTATYTSGNSFSTSTQDANPTGMYWKSDGTKFWTTGAGNDRVYEYGCSTAWDITTASYSQYLSVASQETGPQDVHFKSDGTKMYITGIQGDGVDEYDLSTAWDISTATHNQYLFVGNGTAGNILNPSGLFFKPDGTKMYISGYGNIVNEKLVEFELSTAWDISTASYSHQRNVRVSTDDTKSIYFKPDGTSLFIADASRNQIVRYDV
ncbi:MAG: beta-propeller fold lactonase family protein [Rhodospirillales bacterium]